jgi:hypothetical protein
MDPLGDRKDHYPNEWSISHKARASRQILDNNGELARISEQRPLSCSVAAGLGLPDRCSGKVYLAPQTSGTVNRAATEDGQGQAAALRKDEGGRMKKTKNKE